MAAVSSVHCLLGHALQVEELNDYNPVCGCDNVTYPNVSAADIAGINVRSNGQSRRDIGITSKSSKTGRYSVSKSRKGSRGRKASKNYDEEEKEEEEEFALA